MDVCMFAYLSIYPSIYPSIHLSISLNHRCIVLEAIACAAARLLAAIVLHMREAAAVAKVVLEAIACAAATATGIHHM